MEKKELVDIKGKKVKNGKYYRYLKNIKKQYPHMKAFEDKLMEMEITPYIEALYKKHGLELSSRNIPSSIMLKRWGLLHREEKNIINQYDDIDTYIKAFEAR